MKKLQVNKVIRHCQKARAQPICELKSTMVLSFGLLKIRNFPKNVPKPRVLYINTHIHTRL